ncbi:carbon storage regulator [Pseudomonas sp. TH49]|uniref:carbon storage regulator n=1 Tax=Pseudomonas sp. TH49 TaxID=2796413 RepID=UPI001913CC27|nr:carbon storage regulator [Pseudomonas sp. TH49]
MLILTRKPDQRQRICDEIQIRILQVNANEQSVSLCINAPSQIPIVRTESYKQFEEPHKRNKK